MSDRLYLDPNPEPTTKKHHVQNLKRAKEDLLREARRSSAHFLNCDGKPWGGIMDAGLEDAARRFAYAENALRKWNAEHKKR